MATTTVLLILAVVVAVVGVTVYLVGIPSEWKQAAEEKVAVHMAEGEAKEKFKQQIRNLPEADQQKAEGISSGINAITGGDLKNPLGKKLG